VKKMETYKQNCKQRIRKEALRYAIRALTTERLFSTIAAPTQILNIANAVEREFLETNIMFGLKDETIKRWEKFYKANVGAKKRFELKIAYLCGPEPENDLEIMLQNGVIAENIWAFESNSRCFENAKYQILLSKYPYLKIVKRDIKAFFQTTNIVFDIIYLDFCSTLLQNVDVLTTLFDCHVLSPLGVLITNFSFSDKKEDVQTYNKTQSFVSNYLYYKGFIEAEYRQFGDMVEGPMSQGFSCPECNEICRTGVYSGDAPEEMQEFCNPFSSTVKKKTAEYYGQCITRFLMDLPSSIIPSQRLFINSDTLKNIFGKRSSLQACFEKFIKEFYKPDDSNISVENLCGFLVDDDNWTGKTMYDLYMNYGGTFNDFLQQINISNKKNEINNMIKNLLLFELLIYKNADGVGEHETSFGDFCKNWRNVIKTEYSFCDVFLFHQILEVLLAQIVVPYYCNVGKTKRWTYRAKQHKMFTDLFIYDQARYIFDWLPTPEMISNLNFDLQIELSIRYLLDAFSKNNFYFLSHLFCGCNVVQRTDENTPTLSKRKHIFSKQPQRTRC